MTDDETTKRLITALLAGNERIRDRLEAAEAELRAAQEEIARLMQPEALWYETMMKMLAVAPNHVACSFDMGGRRVEICFYNDGGKTPGEVAAEHRLRVEAMQPIYDHAISVIDNWDRDEAIAQMGVWGEWLYDEASKIREPKW